MSTGCLELGPRGRFVFHRTGPKPRQAVTDGDLAALADVLQRLDVCLPGEAVDIVLRDWPYGLGEGMAIGGNYFGDRMDINMDLGTPVRTRQAVREMPAVIAHELHHVRRWPLMPTDQEGWTLYDGLIFEGSATAFDWEFTGVRPRSSLPPPPDVMQRLWEEILLHGPEPYDHPRWFFGADDLPARSGYRMGLMMVRQYLASHPECTAAALADLPTDVVVQGIQGWEPVYEGVGGPG